mgnify:CR=1 FL=1
MEKLLFAVNGTLMRGFALNKNLLAVNAEFVVETYTSKKYRLWSIDDQYPAMLKDQNKGEKIALELWQLTPEALVTILNQEPPGLCIGKVELNDGDNVLGVLGEPYLVKDKFEITDLGGWKNYWRNKKSTTQ